MNIIKRTDGYKLSHSDFIPDGLTEAYSYLECRPGAKHKFQKFFGLQYYLIKYLEGVQVTEKKIHKAEKFFKTYFGSMVFKPYIWEKIITQNGGKLPLRICAVKENAYYPTGTPLISVENTLPGFEFLVGHVETILSKVWYSIAVSTLSAEFYEVIRNYLRQTSDMGGDDDAHTRLHDFGYRGVSSEESAGIGAASHLLTFTGSDTIAGFKFLEKYYNVKPWASSIAAMEHSSVLENGPDGEERAISKALDSYGPVSIITDTYNTNNCLQNIIGRKLKDKILKRHAPTIIRLDSGVPKDSGLNAFHALEIAFGSKKNSKGYAVLPEYIRLLQGDGVSSPECVGEILSHLKSNGISAENISFGSGGAILQKVNRDTENVAFKTSNIILNGVSHPVHKETPGKVSKSGKFTGMDVVFEDGVVYKRPITINHQK